MTSRHRPLDLGTLAKVAWTTTLILLLAAVVQGLYLKSLPVFSTFVGGILFWYNLLVGFLVALALSMGLALLIERLSDRLKEGEGRVAASRFLWVLYILLVIALAIFSTISALNNGLATDVQYSWILNKAGLNSLDIQYLDGYTVWFTLVFALVVLFSDPRVTLHPGRDGNRHAYIHSKVLGILRSFSADEGTRLGKTADHVWRTDALGKVHFNDLLRFFPTGLVWRLIEFVGALIVGSAAAPQLAVSWRLIQNFLPQTGNNYIGLLWNYLGMIGQRIFSWSITSPSFPIDQSFTFEVWQFTSNFVTLILVIWAIRLFIAGLVSGAIGVRTQIHYGNIGSEALFDAVANLIWLPALYLFGQILWIPTWVFERGVQYDAMQLFFGFLLFLAIGLLFSDRELLLKRIIHLYSGGASQVKVLATLLILIVIVSGLFIPAALNALTVQPYMQGQRFDLSWVPAYLPTIAYTRWAFEIDNVNMTNSRLMATNGTSILDQVRVFGTAAAAAKMSPQVGVNWMTMPPAPDIVFLNNHEYWVAPLQLVLPPYASDLDIWRSQHLLLTHSEKILAIDAATTEFVDATKLLNMTATPQLYYGEGGLFNGVDEVYLNIGNFQETHISNYTGPATYSGTPDYTYSGFWRWFKFVQAFRWDFANGNYGNVKTLLMRDVNSRLSSILIPGMTLDPDAYPVIDDRGNIYVLHWAFIEWNPPSQYLDYPEHSFTNIIRKFAVVLTNLHDGSITGYWMDTSRSDYILNFYRSFYLSWNKPLPNWLVSQLRYPESFLEQQIDAFNFYFQTDFNKWQSNQFYELPMDTSGNVLEDVRYIVVPINGNNAWAATRIVELYKSPSRNLAGVYIAPSQANTGQLYFVDLTSPTFIGPATAISTVQNNLGTKQQLTLHPNWQSGNILTYSIAGNLYYIIPYYAQQSNLILPAMIVVVDAQTQKLGFYVINNPQNQSEVGSAASIAFANLGTGFIAKTLQERIQNVTTYTATLGYTVAYPQSNNPNVSYPRGNFTYTDTTQWNTTQTNIKSFLDSYALPQGVTIVNVFRYIVGENTWLKLSVQYTSSQGVTEQFITINLGK